MELKQFLFVSAIFALVSTSLVLAVPSITVYTDQQTYDINPNDAPAQNYVNYNPQVYQDGYTLGFSDGYVNGRSSRYPSPRYSNVYRAGDPNPYAYGPAYNCNFGNDNVCFYNYFRCGDNWCRAGDTGAPRNYYLVTNGAAGAYPVGTSGYYYVPNGGVSETYQTWYGY